MTATETLDALLASCHQALETYAKEPTAKHLRHFKVSTNDFKRALGPGQSTEDAFDELYDRAEELGVQRGVADLLAE